MRRADGDGDETPVNDITVEGRVLPPAGPAIEDDGEPPVAVAGSSPIEVEVLKRALPGAADPSDVEKPDVVVLVRPTASDWQQARSATPKAIVVVDHARSDGEVVDLVAQGADAVVDLEQSLDAVVETVHRTSEGQPALNDDQVRAVVSALRDARAPVNGRDQLTGRELEILSCIDQGMSVKQTARQLEISAKTVENLQGRLFRKLGVRNRAQAVLVGHQRGLLEAHDQPGEPTP